MFDSIPLNYLYDAPLIWTGDGKGRFTLPVALRRAVQGPTNAPADGTAVGVPCAPGFGPTTCSAATAAAAIANRSIYNTIITRDDIRVKREIFDVKLGYIATPAFGFNVDFQSTGRTGSMPWNASYAFNNANQLPVPIDQRNNELKVGTEWVNPKGMVRVDYWGSYFSNDIQTLTWDNPDSRHRLQQRPAAAARARSTRTATATATVPAFGQAALWPSNTLNSFGLTGMYKALPKTTVNGNVQLTYMRQNESLLPWSLNTSVNNPAVLAAFPGLRALPRTSAEAAVNGLNALVNATSRPTRYLTLQARYRYNEHDNNDAALRRPEYVRFDAVPEEVADDPDDRSRRGLLGVLPHHAEEPRRERHVRPARVRLVPRRLRQREVRPRGTRLQRGQREHAASGLRRHSSSTW